jgi:hypothetical protein
MPNLTTMFACKRPLTPTNAAEVEHIAKRTCLSKDDDAELEELESEDEELAEVIVVTDSQTDEMPKDGPKEDAPIEMPSDDNWSSESEDEFPSGHHADQVNFKEMKAEVKKQQQIEVKVTNMKAIRMLASLSDFYDRVESVG